MTGPVDTSELEPIPVDFSLRTAATTLGLALVLVFTLLLFNKSFPERVSGMRPTAELTASIDPLEGDPQHPAVDQERDAAVDEILATQGQPSIQLDQPEFDLADLLVQPELLSVRPTTVAVTLGPPEPLSTEPAPPWEPRTAPLPVVQFLALPEPHDTAHPAWSADLARLSLSLEHLAERVATRPHCPEPTPQAVGPAVQVTGLLKLERMAEDRDRFSLQANHVPIGTLLQELADLAGKNLVIEPSVTGTLSLTLRDVTLDEAIRGVFKHHGLAATVRGRDWVVTTAALAAARQQAASPLKIQSYPIRFAAAEVIRTHAESLLTPAAGKLKVAESGAGRVAMLMDRPEVHATFARWLKEVDRPPPRIAVTATVYRVDLGTQRPLEFLSVGAEEPLCPQCGRRHAPSTGLIVDEVVTNTHDWKAGLWHGPHAAASLSHLPTTLVATPMLILDDNQASELVIDDRPRQRIVDPQSGQAQDWIAPQALNTATARLKLRPRLLSDGSVRLSLSPGGQQETTLTLAESDTAAISGWSTQTVTVQDTPTPAITRLTSLGTRTQQRTASTATAELVLFLTVRPAPLESAR